MLKVTGLPNGITQSDLDQIFSDYEILKYEMRTEANGSISYFVELRENEVTARKKLDNTPQTIRGERYIIRVDDFLGGKDENCGQHPSQPPCPTPVPKE
ncbi:hypothetical protein ACL6C3_13960 [Capilliphycus salinus ALCB114379]|uniref:hypothetical protein n=1 Tax=Capilliphycus salinus TaxID=2768948 RepID=UPI0039A48032